MVINRVHTSFIDFGSNGSKFKKIYVTKSYCSLLIGSFFSVYILKDVS